MKDKIAKLKTGEQVTIIPANGSANVQCVVSRVSPNFFGFDYFARGTDQKVYRINLGLDGRWYEFSAH